MFNILPGQGLGFTGSKLLAFGLGAMTTEEVVVPPVVVPSGVGGGIGWSYLPVTIHDNAYSRRKDDNEIIEFLTIIFQVIE